MPQPDTSGWLTIHPRGHWYFRAPRLRPLLSSRKRVPSKLGPFALKKPVTLGKAPLVPGSFQTKVRYSFKNHVLTIGPILGILTSGEGLDFKGNRDNFKDIIKSGKKHGALVYVFTPGSIDWEHKKVRGYLYHEKNDIWSEAVMPFPHVVYNRIPTRKVERRDDVRITLQQIAATQNVTLFNPRFFDKHQLFELLEKRPEAVPYLPDTKRVDTFARFKSFCQKYPFVYLKPILGKAGEGIMRIEKNGTRWRLQRVHNQKSITRHFSTLESAWKHFISKAKEKPYLLQEGISLATYQKRPFDIRVLIQRNGLGDWHVTGYGIRRAGKKSITTHVPRGGSILSTDKVLPSLFGEHADLVHQHIEHSALTLARLLSHEIPSLAEMSMDLGLTMDGRIWFFEANSKPEKFDEPNIRRSSLKNIIQYAQYVAKMNR
ncbi:YheC/YheD family endospore coat-associated protein [Brevibacillus dissolubilis]|uniref:YheC/YheD family endospore coat-associated protein n=1 Tax=Brevibacillus dissolubilis TaxID=1844116 RepID=UPI001116C61F|nr:YheC/YheD family protein [Brevibacillus dissolubilis]